MSELISGKDALIALANGEKVECTIKGRDEWVKDPTQIQPYYFIGGGIGQYEFRLKPRTIKINGTELNQCYSVAIDYTRNEVKVEFKNRNDAEALHDVISKLYGFK